MDLEPGSNRPNPRGADIHGLEAQARWVSLSRLNIGRNLGQCAFSQSGQMFPEGGPRSELLTWKTQRGYDLL